MSGRRNNGGRQVVRRHVEHREIPYNRTFRNHSHAVGHPAVRKVFQHHGHHIHNKEAFLSMLASGISIAAALFGVGIALVPVIAML